MGAKLCKRGSYDFEKEFKSYNKLERRAISFISLSASEIYGDVGQDYYRSQSVLQLHEVVTGKLKEENEVPPGPPVTKRNKLTRHDRVTSGSTSPQLQTVQDHRPSYHTISSDNDIFYDALEYYDTISFTTEFDNAAIATLVANTGDPVHQSVKHINSSQSIHTYESNSGELDSAIHNKGEDQVNLHSEDSIPKNILLSTPDILIHSLEALEQHNYEEIRFVQNSVTIERSIGEEIVHCHDMVEKAKNGTTNNAREGELFTRVTPEVEKARELEEATEYRSGPLNDPQVSISKTVLNCNQDFQSDRSVNFTEDVTSQPDVCDHTKFPIEPQMKNLTTKNEERSESIDESVSHLKLIMQEVNRLKTQIDEEIDYVNCYQNLMKVMMDVNAIKNEEFDEEVFSMQNETLAEIRVCLEALKLKKSVAAQVKQHVVLV